VAGGAGADCSNRTQPVTVKLGSAGGKSNVLVDQSGCALYLNNQDTATTTICDATCIATWPPAHAPGTAGDGVQAANLGTFARPDGTSQVTYFGHQLYYNTGDKAPGQANGQATNQTWFLVDATSGAAAQ
jgi:predicted lipoprotein with Yx(FWY)xxD motif